MEFTEEFLKVKTSTIKGTGKGLFTKKPIPKGAIITEYKGKISTWNDADHDDGNNAYIYYLNRNYVIDAKEYPGSLAQFANDAKGFKKIKGFNNNSRYIVKGKRVFIEAVKNIAANEEIFVGYGKEYWDVIKKNKMM